MLVPPEAWTVPAGLEAQASEKVTLPKLAMVTWLPLASEKASMIHSASVSQRVEGGLL